MKFELVIPTFQRSGTFLISYRMDNTIFRDDDNSKAECSTLDKVNYIRVNSVVVFNGEVKNIWSIIFMPLHSIMFVVLCTEMT